MKIYQGQGDFEILTPERYLSESLLTIERAGRTCYQTETGEITQETAKKFIKMIMKRKHFSVIEHGFLAVKFSKVSRGLTHELVRHRLAAFSQESTRYVDYAKGGMTPDLDRFQCEFVLPPHQDAEQKITMPDGSIITPTEMLENIEAYYRALRKAKWPTDDARQFLPNAITSDIVISCNFREWRHIFYMRTAEPAHWEIRAVMIKLLVKLQSIVPVLFDDFVFAGHDKNGLEYYACEYLDNK